MSATPVRVTIAIPIHNEEEVIPQLLERVLAVLDDTPGGPHEMLLVDDGSRDSDRTARRDDHGLNALSKPFLDRTVRRRRFARIQRGD